VTRGYPIIPYRTPAERAAVHPSGWGRLAPGTSITRLPVVDVETGLFARLVYRDAELVAERLGGRLPTREEILELARVGHVIPPVKQSWGPEMITRESAATHDARVRELLAATRWDGVRPVMNAGKHWRFGATGENVAICGWWEGGRLIQQGIGDNPHHLGAARSHHDYGTTTLVVVEGETDPPPTERDMADPIPFRQARNFRRGRVGRVDLLVIHSMEAAEKPGTAEAVAAWFAGPSAPMASAHYCIDQDSIVQCVRDEDTAWHAPGANHNGIGLEHAGYAKQTPAEWADAASSAMLDRSVALAAELCRRHDIPAEFVDAAGLRQGRRGITTHAEVSKAFRRSTHYDPGPGFPLEEYVARVGALIAPPPVPDCP
jgi:hypothetical protein